MVPLQVSSNLHKYIKICHECVLLIEVRIFPSCLDISQSIFKIRIVKLQETLCSMYKYTNSSFGELLEIENAFTIHQRNIQKRAIKSKCKT